MGLFGDLLGAVTGQQKAAPYTAPNLNDMMAQGTGAAAANNIAYNNQVAPAFMQTQLGVEKMYDPNIANLRANTSKAVLDNLALGSELPEDVKRQIMQNAMESGAANGFGLSNAGRGLMARDIGSNSLQLGNARRQEAEGYTRSSPMLNQLYEPVHAFSPSGVTGEFMNQANIQNQRNAQDFYRKEGNKIAMFNTFGRVAGGVAGGMMGGPMGAQMGMNMGGSLISNPYRADTGGGGGGMGGLGGMMGGGGGGMSNIFGSILGGMGGSGGIMNMRNNAAEQGGIPMNSYH